MAEKSVMRIITLLLSVEVVYAALFSYIVYALLSSVNDVRSATLPLLGATSNPLNMMLTAFIYSSISTLPSIYALQLAFSLWLLAFNIILLWRMTSPWKYNYHVLLAQPVIVIVTSIFLMPNAAGAFLIVVSILILAALQSKVVKRELKKEMLK
ncbi:MAG: hypothetical protein QXK94_06730 [Candidatus Jordarchaeales archaeon]